MAYLDPTIDHNYSSNHLVYLRNSLVSYGNYVLALAGCVHSAFCIVLPPGFRPA